MKNELVEKTTAPVIIEDENPMISVIERIAMNPDADISKLEKMLDMQERIEAKQARNAFFDAFSNFQNELPTIEKKKKGHNCMYAPLCDITAVANPFLNKYGLSYRFEQESVQGGMNMSCIITHKLGHFEKTTMFGPYETSGSKNVLQAAGSTVTYLQRYTFIGAAGITTADEDSDGRVSSQKTPEEQYSDYLDLYKGSIEVIRLGIDSGDLSSASEAWYELTQEEQGNLWKAPSKGGPFTTAQRAVMKTSEFAQANK